VRIELTYKGFADLVLTVLSSLLPYSLPYFHESGPNPGQVEGASSLLCSLGGCGEENPMQGRNQNGSTLQC